jgi:hypothetical protein
MIFGTKKLSTAPIEFSQAAEFVRRYHRHNNKVVGHKFSLGLYNEGVLVGVAIIGRPVSRHLDNGECLEITRLCLIEGVKNGCSKLYAACINTAKAKGFKSIITYTLESENGASLKAANFTLDKQKAGGRYWTGKRKFVTKTNELKTRWKKDLV